MRHRSRILSCLSFALLASVLASTAGCSGGSTAQFPVTPASPGTPTSPAAPVTYTLGTPEGFWGQEATTKPTTSPSTVYGAIRMNSTTWPTIETSRPLALSNWDFATVVDKYKANYPAGTDFLYTLYRTPTASSFGNSSDLAAPHDVITVANCVAPMPTSPATTDCQLKEFIVGLMEHTCGVSTIPANTPATNNCWIKHFELWNEFNAGYWNDTLMNLAHMGVDAASYIRLFCGDCTISAGSTTGGGAGGLSPKVGGYTPDPSGTGTDSYYDTTLEALLNDWYVIGGDAVMPDFISWHPYPTYYKYTNAVTGQSVPLDPAPFPESPVSGDGMGLDNNNASASTPGSDFHNGSAGCPAKIVDEYTAKQCGDSLVLQAQKMTSVVASATYHMAGKPVWATEGGYSALFDLQGTTSTGTGVTSRDVLRANYMARWLILLRAGGIARVYPYSYDNNCWMPQNLYTTSSCTSVTATGWTAESVPAGETSAGLAWLQVENWLSGATVPVCAANASQEYACTVSRTTPTGYHATIFWASAWAATDTTFVPTPPSGLHFTQYRDLSGNMSSYTSGAVPLTGSPLIFEGIN